MRKTIIPISILILIVLLLAACQPAATSTSAAVSEPTAAPTVAADDGEVVLEIAGKDGSKSLTMTQLKELTATEGMAGIKTSTGRIVPPELYKGVLLTDLLNQVGGLDETMAVQIEAKDGYAMTFSPNQIANGEFIAYDPGTGDEVKEPGKLQVLIAYEKNGQALNTDEEGNLRLVVINDDPSQVTDGHWSIKWVAKVSIKPLAAEWNLQLEGAITDEIDRGSFESCSTGKCHPSTFTDDKAQVWSGTPLFILVGRIDDELKHDTGAFNRDLAEAGYAIDIVASDGYTITLDSAMINNPDIVVANAVNGNPLTDKDFPLKLVGPGLSKKEMVGGIAKIVLRLDEKAVVEPTAEPTKEIVSSTGPVDPNALLNIFGLVDTPKAWSLEDLKALDQVKVTAEHPKKGKQDYEGVLLKTLFDLVGLKPDAKTLILTASDGFSAEVSLEEVAKCPECMLNLGDGGNLHSVMPGFPSNAWVKQVVSIEVK